MKNKSEEKNLLELLESHENLLVDIVFYVFNTYAQENDRNSDFIRLCFETSLLKYSLMHEAISPEFKQMQIDEEIDKNGILFSSDNYSVFLFLIEYRIMIEYLMTGFYMIVCDDPSTIIDSTKIENQEKVEHNLFRNFLNNIPLRDKIENFEKLEKFSNTESVRFDSRLESVLKSLKNFNIIQDDNKISIIKSLFLFCYDKTSSIVHPSLSFVDDIKDKDSINLIFRDCCISISILLLCIAEYLDFDTTEYLVFEKMHE